MQDSHADAAYGGRFETHRPPQLVTCHPHGGRTMMAA
jgi:hypothetical protein